MKYLFKKAHKSYLCNTSYPLSKDNWNMYKDDNCELFNDEKQLCFYIHIPFCVKLCSFCEYVKYPNSTKEREYLEILRNDINNFILKNQKFTLYGFDIGGGTPTSLGDEDFKLLMDIFKDITASTPLISDFEPSIEATFDTLTKEKAIMIKNAGINRISLGIQTTNNKILNDNNRFSINNDTIKQTINMIKEIGINKINLDFMYGIENQTKSDLKNSLKLIKQLKPTHVTLYEMRYNRIKRKKVNKNKLFNHYKYIYKQLKKMGYNAHFGQNTFSFDEHDLGLSSYLRYRMIDNVSYKGFGISAQSKSKTGISYNIGTSKEKLSDCLEAKTFYPKDTYILPKEEMLAKYIAISLYYGKFKLSIMEGILKDNPLIVYKKEFKFLKRKRLIKIKNDLVTVTKKGYKYYGAIGALFYSNNVKNWLLGSD